MSATPAGVTTVYGLARCDTCRKARKRLDANDIEYGFVDYRDEPIAPGTLETWAGQLGGWDKLVNRASTTWRGLSDGERSAASGADWLALIAAHPTLIRRPVLVTPDGAVSVRFSEKTWAQRLGI